MASMLFEGDLGPRQNANLRIPLDKKDTTALLSFIEKKKKKNMIYKYFYIKTL